MLKVAGVFCVMGAAVWLLHRLSGERKRQWLVLEELASVLDFMGDEIRVNQTPMYRLLQRAAAGRCPDVAAFLNAARENSAVNGLAEAWRQAAGNLPVMGTELRLLSELGHSLTGDEERVCRGLTAVSTQLQAELQRQRKTAAEVDRRKTALCLSGAAFVIILLI